MPSCRACPKEALASGLCVDCQAKLERIRSAQLQAKIAAEKAAIAAIVNPAAASKRPGGSAKATADKPRPCVQCRKTLEPNEPVRCAECIEANRRGLKEFRS